ncbi:MAG: 50S ribosomal protein L19 [Candidatus Omnitrophota bacterium]
MNTQLLEKIEKPQMKKVPELRAGDVVRVHQKIKEGKKERVQVFEGVVLRVKGGGLRQSFLVRKISFGIGVEKNFLIHSPNIVKIEIRKRAKVRQAYLTYLRKLTGKGARLKDKQFDSLIVNVKEEVEPVEETLDKEATEIDKEAVADVEAEVPLAEVEKAEEKEAAKDAGEEIDSEEGGQDAEVAEIEEGLEEADKDAEKGKDKKEVLAEEDSEVTTQEEIVEEIKEEKVTE